MAQRAARTSLDPERLRSLGAAIRSNRHGRLSLEALAAKAGISTGQLSQIENGRGNPTVEVLIRIGTALGVETTDFLERRAPGPTYVVRADARRRFHVVGMGREVDLLTPDIRQDFAVAATELHPGQTTRTEPGSPRYSGEVVIFVLEGEATVILGTGEQVLHESDAYSGASPIRLENRGDRLLRCISAFRPADD